MICSLVLLVQLMSTKLLTDLYLIVIEVVLLLINAGHVIIQLPIRRVKTSKVVCGLLAVLLSGLMLYGSVAAASGKSALLAIAGNTLQKTTSYVVVMDDDPARSIGDTVGYTFGILSEDADISADNTRPCWRISRTAWAAGGYQHLHGPDLPGRRPVRRQRRGHHPQLRLSHRAGFSLDDYSTFSKDTRIIYEFSTTKEVEPIKPNASITSQPFVVYCSGIDARSSDINIQSLSDVNILAVIHPRTHQILLINTPRDYYVPLARNGQRDKLTHAGMYGIDESAAVLGNLYGVKADYYARVNFAGLKKIVDALDGVDVNSELRVHHRWHGGA
ncbi:MAG: LCP family protein [Oscillospiraceae bacterium]